MVERYGIIFINTNEIIIKIYTAENHRIKLVRSQEYNVTPPKRENVINSTQILEVIAELSLARVTAYIREWKIYVRGLPIHIVREISLGTSLATENLTLPREKELLCKGMMYELT